MKKFASVFLTLVMCASLFASLTTTASAGLFDRVETGQMQDTSSENNGIIYWELDGSVLTISGNGYMPNGTDQCWSSALGSRKLTKLIIEEGVKSIMDSAFYGQDRLKSVTLPDSLEFIGDSAFAETGIQSVVLPKNLQTFNGTIFNSQEITQYSVNPKNPYFKAVDGVVYSKDMTELVAYPVGKYANGGDNTFKIPETVKKIGDYAFLNCKHTSFTIPANVKTIGMQAFAGNTELSTIDFINGVESIYDGAFLACNNISSFHLPTSVKYIGYCSLAFGYDFDYEGLEFMLDQKGINHGEVNESNAVYYASLTGFPLDSFIICVVNKDTKIYAPKNSAGHNYCKMFGVEYRSSQAITPKLVSAKQTAAGVEIQWTYSSDADGYYILRKNKSGDYVKIATVKGKEILSYTDEKAYSSYENTYTVKAYNSGGVSRYFTDGVSAYYIATPKLSSVSNHYNGVELYWEKSSDIADYSIYRKVENDDVWELIATVSKSNFYYIDENVVNLKNYQYTVLAYDDNGVSEYNNVGTGIKYVEAPRVTTFEKLTEGVNMCWEKVDGATSYVIYRKKDDGDWELLKELDNATFTYIDESIVSGGEYSYAIKAVNSGTESGYYIQIAEFLDPPKLSSVSNQYNGVKVSWEAVSGAENYNIYRKTNDNPEWEKIGTVGKTTPYYIDEAVVNSENYQYTVNAYNDNCESEYNNVGIGIKYVATPGVTTFGKITVGVQMCWEKVDGATSYVIYRKTDDGDWKLLKELDNATFAYIDESLESSGEYSYAIKAVSSGAESGYYIQTIQHLATPKLSSASNTNKGIKVSWEKVSGATNYKVYRKLKGQSSWKYIGKTSKSRLYYVDSNVSDKNTYYYTVSAYNNEVVSDYNKKGVSRKYVKAPTVSSFNNSANGVYLKWSKVSGATSYRVYRKTGNGNWKLIKKLNNETFKYTDKDVKSGVKYSYAVKAVNSVALSGYYEKTTKFLKMPVIKNVKSTKSGITVNYSKTTGADKYYIYRKLNGADDWKRITTVKGSSKVSYTDKTAKKGKTYRYTVRAYSGSYKSAYDTKGYKIKDKY